MNITPLLIGQTANIVTSALPIANAENKAVTFGVALSGTFDSATVALEGSHDGTTWFTLGSWTAQVLTEVSAHITHVRASVTGVVTAASLNLDLLNLSGATTQVIN